MNEELKGPPDTPEERLQQATWERDEADTYWLDVIRDCHKAGMSHRAIAPLAGISYQRVGQILKG